MSKYNLKTDEDMTYCEPKLNSARDLNKIKGNFSLFLQRKDNKNNRPIKRFSINSNNSNDIANDLSFDQNDPSMGMRHLRHSTQIDVIKSFRNSLNNKPMFSLFEENVKDQKQFLRNAKLTLNRSSEKISPTIKTNSINIESYTTFFKATEIGENESTPQQNKKNKNDYFTLNRDAQIEINHNLNIQIKSLLDDFSNNIQNYLNLQNSEKMNSEKLKELRTERNKIITEKVMLVNELDFLNSAPKINKISTQRNSIASHPWLEKMKSLNIEEKDSEDILIDELENKLSILKSENSYFFENIDILNDEVVNNEEKNKEYKNHIKLLDKKIDALLKEKNSLKSTLNKLVKDNKSICK